jgi:hypothetical protein
VLSGVGGIGKTQLITEYIYTHRSAFTSVLWVTSASQERIQASFEGFTQTLIKDFKNKHRNTKNTIDIDELETPSTDGEASRAVSFVLNWLSRPGNDGWLLVFDSYDNIEEIDIGAFLPSVDVGHVLISTRRPEVGRLGYHLPLDFLSLDDSVALLLKSAQQEVGCDSSRSSMSLTGRQCYWG